MWRAELCIMLLDRYDPLLATAKPPQQFFFLAELPSTGDTGCFFCRLLRAGLPFTEKGGQNHRCRYGDDPGVQWKKKNGSPRRMCRRLGAKVGVFGLRMPV
jgi:hypothetical protein